MALRAVPSVTTRRMAPAMNAACDAGSTSTGASVRGLLASVDPSAFRHAAARRDGRRHARHLEWRDQHLALPVRGERQRAAQT